MAEPDDKSNFLDIVRSPSGNLARIESKLVRRGLDELSKLTDKPWWLVERECPLVLLVDGDSNTDGTIEKILNANGYETRSSSSVEAVELARCIQPQVAIVRHIPQVQDGIQMGKELRKVTKLLRVVLSVTAEDELDLMLAPLFDPLFERQRFAILGLPADSKQLLQTTSASVCMMEERRRSVARVLSNSVDRIVEFAQVLSTALSAEIGRSEYHGYECSVIGVRIDVSWQEQRGDALLHGMRNLPRLLDERMESLCRPYAVFRDAGSFCENCFAVVLPQTPKTAANDFVNKLHSSIRGTNWRQIVGSSAVTTAVTLAATYPQDGMSAGELLDLVWFENRMPG